jgi:hypothetical protein
MPSLPKLPKIKPHMVKPVKAKMPQKVKPKLPGQDTEDIRDTWPFQPRRGGVS